MRNYQATQSYKAHHAMSGGNSYTSHLPTKVKQKSRRAPISAAAMEGMSSGVSYPLHLVRCTVCHEKFTVVKWRHKCESCRVEVCSDCSEYRLELRDSKKPVRVCDLCFATTVGGGRIEPGPPKGFVGRPSGHNVANARRYTLVEKMEPEQAQKEWDRCFTPWE